MAPLEEEQLAGSASAAVKQIEQLRTEIIRAVSAISGNSVAALEESLQKQEVLCLALKHLLQAVGEEEVSHAAKIRVQATMKALYRLSKSYANLVEQSRASNHLLHTLCARYNERAVGSRTQINARYSVEV